MVPNSRDSPFRIGKDEAQSAENKNVDPVRKTNGMSEVTATLILTSNQEGYIYTNETNDSELLNELRQALRRWVIGLDDRTSGSGLDKSKTAAVDLKRFVVVGIIGRGNRFGRR